MLGAYGQLAFGEAPDLGPTVTGDNEEGKWAYGAFAFGQFAEIPIDSGLAPALEADQALSLTIHKTFSFGIATEEDSGLPVTAVKQPLLGYAIEYDGAYEIAIYFTGRRRTVAAIAR